MKPQYRLPAVAKIAACSSKRDYSATALQQIVIPYRTICFLFLDFLYIVKQITEHRQGASSVEGAIVRQV